jgi:kynurenine formamidase
VKRNAIAVLALTITLAGPALAHAGGFPEGEVIDLSHAYDARTIYWPTEDGFVLEKEFAGINQAGFYYASNRFRTPEHGGTHIDAPRHFHRGGLTVDRIPLEQLMGPAILVDVSAACAKDRDYQVRIADFTSWEKRHGRIPTGAIVILRTGFGKYWPDRKRYLGTEARGAKAIALLHFPGLGVAAANWLVDQRGVKAVGLDTASIDHGQSRRFMTHRALFARNVPAFENLANLDRLPPKGFTVIALPMKIAGGSGGPLRAVAILPSSR